MVQRLPRAYRMTLGRQAAMRTPARVGVPARMASSSSTRARLASVSCGISGSLVSGGAVCSSTPISGSRQRHPSTPKAIADPG